MLDRWLMGGWGGGSATPQRIGQTLALCWGVTERPPQPPRPASPSRHVVKQIRLNRMPRERRIHRVNDNTPGDAHELTFSVYQRFPFLNSDRTCQRLANAIDEAREKHSFWLWAYVFMTDHVHLLLYPFAPVYDIAQIRKAIKEPVGRKAIRHMEENSPAWLDKLTRERGGKTERLFWQSGGGYDRNVTESKTLEFMIEYIHDNPVRRGLVDDARKWKWSSAAWYADGTVGPLRIDPIPPEWLVSFERRDFRRSRFNSR